MRRSISEYSKQTIKAYMKKNAFLFPFSAAIGESVTVPYSISFRNVQIVETTVLFEGTTIMGISVEKGRGTAEPSSL